ncbi:MAG TPA: FkbM family methyltransferase [Bryobacteraceae bacterium]|nr:FkbM family methyltransferase [Bryobacteraceae bacterium]
MNLRKSIKKLVYGRAGYLPYMGTRIYFPPNAFILEEVCAHGIYEEHILQHIRDAVVPGTWYFDAGANTGFLSVPILRIFPDVKVLSFEPSPNTKAYLQRTWRASPWQDRWTIVNKAVGDHSGEVEFSVSDSTLGGYDGLKDTKRVASRGKEIVPMTTLDEEWRTLGRPRVSCIKMDVEGAEMLALNGARELIGANHPWIFLEWYKENFQWFGNEAKDLLDAADELGYELVSLRNLSVIRSTPVLTMQMRVTSAFVLAPRDPAPAFELQDAMAGAGRVGRKG